MVPISAPCSLPPFHGKFALLIIFLLDQKKPPFFKNGSFVSLQFSFRNFLLHKEGCIRNNRRNKYISIWKYSDTEIRFLNAQSNSILLHSLYFFFFSESSSVCFSPLTIATCCSAPCYSACPSSAPSTNTRWTKNTVLCHCKMKRLSWRFLDSWNVLHYSWKVIKSNIFF